MIPTPRRRHPAVRRGGVRLVATVVTVCVALAVPAASAARLVAQDDEPGPSVTLDLAGAGFGEYLGVRGENWPPNSVVFVELCGNEARNGTADCDQVNARALGVSSAGSFGVPLLVGNPPVACPCVVRVTSQSSLAEVTVPVEIRGAPVAGVDDRFDVPRPDRRLAFTEARLEGSGPWTALFGAPPHRTLVFTVVNTGQVRVNNPAITLRVGKGADPSGFVEAPDLGTFAPGESKTFRVDVELPVFAVGTYAVEGDIPGFGVPVHFRTETTHIPWLLLLLPVLALLQVGLLAARNRLRRRLGVEPAVEREPAPALVPPAPALPAGGVIDLRDEPLDVPGPAPVGGPATPSDDTDETDVHASVPGAPGDAAAPDTTPTDTPPTPPEPADTSPSLESAAEPAAARPSAEPAATTAEAASPSPIDAEPASARVGVAEAVEAELTTALAAVARARADEELAPDAALELVVELTLEATSRARERFDLDIDAAADLAEILARSLLDEIGLDRLQRPGQLLAP